MRCIRGRDDGSESSFLPLVYLRTQGVLGCAHPTARVRGDAFSSKNSDDLTHNSPAVPTYIPQGMLRNVLLLLVGRISADQCHPKGSIAD